MQMATARDLAKQLGVSVSAVSIALNGKPGISEETRQRILAAADEMGYRKRAWNGRKTPVLELLVYLDKDGVELFNANPFFSRVIEGITGRCQELGYSLQIAYMREEELDGSSVRGFVPTECSGLLLLASSMPERCARAFLQLPVPVVFIDNAFRRLKANCVSIDNEFAIFSMVDHLIALGHRRIGYIGYVSPIANFQDRENAFCAAMEAHGLSCGDLLILQNCTGAAAVEETKQALCGISAMPTAFVCANDWIAASYIRALTELGLRVPENVSVTGFDNIPLSEMIAPGITTVDIPKASIGVLAVNRLAELMGGSCRSVRLQVLADIVARGSVAACGKNEAGKE